MDSGAREKEIPKPRGMSRRTFLDTMIGGGAGLVAGTALNKMGIQKPIEGVLGVNRDKTTVDAGSDLQLEKASKEQLNQEPQKSEFDRVFEGLQEGDKGIARSMVDEMKYEVLYPHSSFNEMMAVTNTFQSQIREAAKEFGLPSDLVSGMVFVENGGGVDQTSDAGARGPAQLLPDTARQYGLLVNEEVDERTNPDKCFLAMCNYLSDLRDKFGGDLGIAVWGYHAGDGNVYGTLRAYFQDTEGIDLGDIISDSADEAMRVAQAYSQKIKQTKLNIHRLLSNSAAKYEILVNRGLTDETELYTYKAVGGAEIFAEQNGD